MQRWTSGQKRREIDLPSPVPSSRSLVRWEIRALASFSWPLANLSASKFANTLEPFGRLATPPRPAKGIGPAVFSSPGLNVNGDTQVGRRPQSSKVFASRCRAPSPHLGIALFWACSRPLALGIGRTPAHKKEAAQTGGRGSGQRADETR